MKPRKLFIKELPVITVVLLPLFGWILFQDAFPEYVELNGLSDSPIKISWMIFFQGSFGILMYFLFLSAQLVNPKMRNYEVYTSHFYKIRLIIALFISLLMGVFMTSQLGIPFDEGRIIRLAAYILFTLTGNYIYTLKPNYFIGFRTPWALEDEFVWRKTHRFGAKAVFLTGIAGILFSFFPQDNLTGSFFFLGFTGLMIFLPVIYSYKVYKARRNS